MPRIAEGSRRWLEEILEASGLSSKAILKSTMSSSDKSESANSSDPRGSVVGGKKKTIGQNLNSLLLGKGIKML